MRFSASSVQVNKGSKYRLRRSAGIELQGTTAGFDRVEKLKANSKAVDREEDKRKMWQF